MKTLKISVYPLKVALNFSGSTREVPPALLMVLSLSLSMLTRVHAATTDYSSIQQQCRSIDDWTMTSKKVLLTKQSGTNNCQEIDGWPDSPPAFRKISVINIVPVPAGDEDKREDFYFGRDGKLLFYRSLLEVCDPDHSACGNVSERRYFKDDQMVGWMGKNSSQLNGGEQWAKTQKETLDKGRQSQGDLANHTKTDSAMCQTDWRNEDSPNKYATDRY